MSQDHNHAILTNQNKKKLWIAFGYHRFSAPAAHVIYDRNYDHSEHLLSLLQEMLAKKFEVYHTAFQFETKPCDSHNLNLSRKQDLQLLC